MVKKFILGTILSSLLILGLLAIWEEVPAEEEEPGPQRQTEIVVAVSEYVWWLARWGNNEIVCSVVIDREGLPAGLDVWAHCGEDLYQQWIVTPPCPEAIDGGSTSACEGLYVFLADIRPGEKRVMIELPLPTIRLSLAGCTPTPPQNRCGAIPSLRLIAEEPLPNEHITELHVIVEETQYDCLSDVCEIFTGATTLDGSDIEFWANSTFGDETEHFRGRVRIVDGGLDPETRQSIWFVDVLSTQWQGSAVDSCAASWEAFPTIGEPPLWLSTPEDVNELYTDTPFVFLAGQLISQGIVDVGSCPQNGLLPNGAANACGLEQSRTVVTDWQNQFDQTILKISTDTTVPAHLLKNVFAQESQFWPGVILSEEFGLGQLTEMGTDSPLLWNASFYNEFCPLILHQETCSQGFAQLDPAYQEMLRGAMAAGTNATCPECESGLDLTRADNSVRVFAETLLGNCEQVSYIVYDITGQMPGRVSSYEDLWRYTLMNYNAGPGCLATALNAAWRNTGDWMTWSDVEPVVTQGCIPALNYVARVTRNNPAAQADFLVSQTAAPYVSLTPARTSTPTLTPPSSATPTATIDPNAPTPTPSATRDPDIYPAPTEFVPTPYP
jgi:hypothetical protein